MSTPSPAPRKRRRQRERFLLISILLLVVFLGFLKGWFFQFQSDLSLLNNILLFGLINLNVILLLLLAYLVLRNIVKLIFERKRNILGHRLRTRLVIAFVGFALIPTLPLFWIATQFISISLDYWFSQQVEQSLEQAVALGKDYLKQAKEDLSLDCQLIRNAFPGASQAEPYALVESDDFRSALLQQFHLDAVLFLDERGQTLWQARSPRTPPVDATWFQAVATKEDANSPKIQMLSLENGREGMVGQVVSSFTTPSSQEIHGRLVVLRLVPASITEKLAAIAFGYEDYLQLKLLRHPLKTSHIVTFSIITLMVVFAAVWFGFFLAKNITVPVQALVAATLRMSEGDLDVHLEWERHDEIGLLISSFNKMVRDQRQSREQLTGAYQALQHTHAELENRRRYMEIVLKNIAAGVVSLDADGKIMTMNKSAEATFGLRADEVRGRPYWQFLQPAHLETVKSFVDAHRVNRQDHFQKKIQVMLGNRPTVLRIKASILRDENDRYLGVVVVLDDLTDLEKAQRMAAWREVARRIAHEIKNPLTPIQLSAQRLRRKYPHLMEGRESIFEECTGTIVQQVNHMKHLVNEFTGFARLPRAHLVPCDFPTVVEESLSIYRHTYPAITIILEKNGEFPPLKLDRDQFKQVMINLLDNAIHALGSEFGTICIRLFFDPILKIARLECSDTGHGITAEDKLRMFEPYYSTKERGAGLGLAIVASIIADHNGFVRVRDNMPQGTVIIIELPVDDM